ncbi:MAG TPA: acetyl-CoA C-acetyltransferase [Gemmatimonadaceae bacterium]|nr:acetyl-CoA C-acetyltransferase [Gemmatimonadaceae bacterium]
MTNPDTTPVIVGAARTPIGRFLGGLGALSAPDLGAVAIKAALERSKVNAADIDEVIMGHVVQGGTGQAPARQAAIKAGVPNTVPAFAVNKVCGSGLQAVMLAAQAIRAGDQRVVVAGGQESMSSAPFYMYGARTGVKFGDQSMADGVIRDGLWCSFYQRHMGGHAEYTARKAGVDRARQDEFALKSHQKAVAAMNSGKFETEIAPVTIAGRKEPTIVKTDESPRADTSLEALAKLKPAFAKDAPKDIPADKLSVTAGNAPGLNDGGAAVIVVSEAYARAHGLNILARITGYASGGGDPQDLFFAPIVAVQNLMKKTGSKIGDYQLIEANEAFAVQALADGDALGWDWDRVNVNGGAIALGHPIGASGARVLVTLLHAMKQRGAGTGLATLCLGGGNAVALSVEAV